MRPLLLLLAACASPKPGGGGVVPADSAGDSGAACAAPAGEPALDAWGGDTRARLDATGWFRVEQLCGRWWFVDPEGHPLPSIGVNHAAPRGSAGQESGRDAYAETVAATYASTEAWAEASAARLRSWGLNTAGAWSDQAVLAPHLAQAPVLDLSGVDWVEGTVVDWYDPAWEAAVAATVEARVAPWAAEPGVLGWFLANEIRWGPDWRGLDTLLQLYLAMGPDAPGKAVAVDLLLDRLGGVAAVDALTGGSHADRDALLADTEGWDALSSGRSDTADALTTAFLEGAAERYFSVTTEAVRAAAPHHLVLGNRDVVSMTRVEVVAAAARHVDVLSFNDYVFRDGIVEAARSISGGLDPAGGLAQAHAIADLPVLVSEFGFRAADSGLPNSWPPIYPTLDTQADRAAAFAAQALELQEAPWIVGHHWFEYVDQPAEGRFDGEDNNWGLVSEADVPYGVLVAEMARVDALWAGRLALPAP